MPRLTASDWARAAQDMSPGRDDGFAGAASTVVFGALAQALGRGDAVPLPGVGVIAPRVGAPRKGFNIHTKSAVTIPARTRLVFTPDPVLRQVVAQLPT